MCFPSKKQKNNFADTNKEEEPKSIRNGKEANNTKAAPAIPTEQPNAPLSNSTVPAPTLPPATTEAPIEMSPPKVAIIIYSMYGHIAKRMFRCFIHGPPCLSVISSLVAEAEKAGIEEAGGKADIFQYVFVHIVRPHFLNTKRLFCRVAETLSQEILTKMYAPAKPDYPIITPDIISTYDAFILGIPTRYGNMPAQWKVNFVISAASSSSNVKPFVPA